jgi:hypothetical protein
MGAMPLRSLFHENSKYFLGNKIKCWEFFRLVEFTRNFEALANSGSCGIK